MARVLCGALMLIVMGCSQSPAQFQHDLTPPPSPWLGVPIENNDDKFTFAIFTDLNGGEREGIFNVAVEQLNQFRPDFIMSVGDLISGGTDDKEQLLKEFANSENKAVFPKSRGFFEKLKKYFGNNR